MELQIERLADHQHFIPDLVAAFEKEWPEHYGQDGAGSAVADINSYASIDTLPVGLIAYCGDRLYGHMALKPSSITSLPHLTPWAAAGYVIPEFRQQGVGAKLLIQIEKLAEELKFSRIYCGTSKAHGLLLRGGWDIDQVIHYDESDVTIYSKRVEEVSK
ncbi:MAG: GNAT family N-acetyltransferase [Endozoicomonas sp.]|uniref:GNAT family N-acetyltransferase n=1 Tax=Endozoicomonas sp. TaxID=1892382 RepID=UPI003D9ACC3F